MIFCGQKASLQISHLDRLDLEVKGNERKYKAFEILNQVVEAT